LLRLQPEQTGLVDLVVTLTDDQLEEIADREAEQLTDHRAPEPVPEQLTVAEAAALARVTAKTIYHRRFDGKLTAGGSRGRPLIDRPELEALLAAGPSSEACTAGPTRRAPSDVFGRMARER
jgi:hypothetical protein